MSKSTISSVFPDVNVWLALSFARPRTLSVRMELVPGAARRHGMFFCRVTQLGLLRLLTTRAAMGLGTLTQAEAWQAYDRWLESGGAEFVAEDVNLEARFRSSTNSPQASPKEWADAYLAAFSFTIGSRLVTFDRALAGKVKGAVLLG
jgi:toxin-antitoxin system PIN domain toxin